MKIQVYVIVAVVPLRKSGGTPPPFFERGHLKLNQFQLSRTNATGQFHLSIFKFGQLQLTSFICPHSKNDINK